MRSVWKCSAACLPSRSPRNPLETRQHLLETRTILQCSHGSVAFARASARDLCDMNGCHFQIIAKNIWHQTYSSTVAPRTSILYTLTLKEKNDIVCLKSVQYQPGTTIRAYCSATVLGPSHRLRLVFVSYHTARLQIEQKRLHYVTLGVACIRVRELAFNELVLLLDSF